MSVTSTEMRLNALREKMSERNVSVYMVSNMDHHLTQYPPVYFHQVEYLTGCGIRDCILLVTQNNVHFWTNREHADEAARSMEGTGVVIHIVGDETDDISDIMEFFRAAAQATMDSVMRGEISISGPVMPDINGEVVDMDDGHQVIGLDGRCFSFDFMDDLLDEIGPAYELGAVEIDPAMDLVGEIWKDRKVLEPGKIRIFNGEEPREVLGGLSVTPETITERMSDVRTGMRQIAPDAGMPVMDLEDIAWMFDIRGDGGDFRTMPLAYAYLTQEEAYLFVYDGSMTNQDKRWFARRGVTIRDYGEFYQFLEDLENKDVILDRSACSTAMAMSFLTVKGNTVATTSRFVATFRGMKDFYDVTGSAFASSRDGKVMAEMMYWAYNAGKTELTDENIIRKLRESREKEGMVCEGEPTEIIRGKNTLVLRFGTDYERGTSTVARTFLIGKPDSFTVAAHTAAVKALLEIQDTKIPAGLKDTQFDALIRTHLWQWGFDYSGPTGQGIGDCTGVDAGPSYLRYSAGGSGNDLRKNAVIYAGPRYIDEDTAVRVENVFWLREPEKMPGDFLEVHCLTDVPIDPELLDLRMMTVDEMDKLLNYNLMGCQMVNELIGETEGEWFYHRFMDPLMRKMADLRKKKK